MSYVTGNIVSGQVAGCLDAVGIVLNNLPAQHVSGGTVAMGLFEEGTATGVVHELGVFVDLAVCAEIEVFGEGALTVFEPFDLFTMLQLACFVVHVMANGGVR